MTDKQNTRYPDGSPRRAREQRAESQVPPALGAPAFNAGPLMAQIAAAAVRKAMASK